MRNFISEKRREFLNSVAKSGGLSEMWTASTYRSKSLSEHRVWIDTSKLSGRLDSVGAQDFCDLRSFQSVDVKLLTEDRDYSWRDCKERVCEFLNTLPMSLYQLIG